jgi:hypothetical protein
MGSRASGVVAFLALVASWRIDQAVRTAYGSGWTAVVIKQARCGGCRLPSVWWIVAHIGLGIAWVALLALALRPLRRVAGPEREPHLRTTWRIFFAVALTLEAGASVFRGLADSGGHGTLDRWAIVTDFVVLGVLGVFVLVALSTAGRGGAVHKLRTFLQRHRINVVGLALLVVILDFVTDTSGQAIDSVRTWLLGDRTHLAHLGFGLAATIVLALVVYETSLRLARSHAGLTKPVAERPPIIQVGWWAAAAGLVVAGLVLRLAADSGWGITILGGLMLVLGALDHGSVSRLQESAKRDDRRCCRSGTDAGADEPDPGSAPELLALVPLLAIASVAIAGAIDSILNDAPSLYFKSFALVFPAVLLGLVAVVMTGDGSPAPVPALPRLRGWAAAGGVILVLLVPLFFNSELAAAVVAFLLLAGTFAYATVLFHARPDRLGNRYWFIVLPAALLGGLTTIVALNADVFGVSHVLGVFGLVDVALAGILAALFWLAQWAIDRRPPRLLALIGFEQLPILSLLAVWWVLAGLVAPATLHDVQLTHRATPTGRAPATLADSFHTWVAEHAKALSATSDTPVPLVLVAAHGGGIRSAYWTALALDCIVGATADAADASYHGACEQHRRTSAQERSAASHIFLISSVSGGAVGTYAYARELLAHASLEPGWVKHQLGGDFASPTIGWGLFHDLPNHLVGLHPGRGGLCGFSPGGECLESDRAAVLAKSFDRLWPGPRPTLRGTWDDRTTSPTARLVPLLIFNSTVVGGVARAVDSPISLSDWPHGETSELGSADAVDNHPLAGTPQVLAALCADNDMQLSTAALLAGRFPYVSPAGRLNGDCSPYRDPSTPRDGACAESRSIGSAGCQMELVDGGYIDNSGLATVDTVFPTIRKLVEQYNGQSGHRQIAVVVLELDNYYRATASEAPSADSTVGQTLAPPLTAFGGRNSVETVARADAYRLTPPGCTITLSPAQHPGLHAPVGWEISPSAERELQNGLVAERNTDKTHLQPLPLIEELQRWLAGSDAGLGPCVPRG